MNQADAITLGDDERALLLELAREALRRHLAGEPPPDVAGCRLPPALGEARGCFVTLTAGGRLRGCIGNVEPRWPLWRAVVHNAVAAATRDRRFEPVTAGELGTLCVEISVLSAPVPLKADTPQALLEQLTPGRDGVVLHLGDRSATFLPQVWDKLPDKREFLSHLAVKAGGQPEDWRSPDARFAVYRAGHFAEDGNVSQAT